MRLGLISDVHGQIHALERSFSILHARGAQRLICAGDLVDKGPHPDAVVHALNEALVPSVLGNHDANAIEHAKRMPRGSELQLDTLEILESLPMQRNYVFGSASLWLTHALPGCLNTIYHPQAVPKKFKRALRYEAPDFLVLGHHHSPICARYRDTWVLNPGSVCRGRAKDSHTCAILDLADSWFAVFDIQTRQTIMEVDLTDF